MEGFKTLAEGDRVAFDMEHGPRGPAANHVVKVESTAMEAIKDVLDPV